MQVNQKCSVPKSKLHHITWYPLLSRNSAKYDPSYKNKHKRHNTDLGVKQLHACIIPIKLSTHNCNKNAIYKKSVHLKKHILFNVLFTVSVQYQFKFQPTRHCRLLDMLGLVFDTVGVAAFIVYHFVLFCRPVT